MKQMMAVILTLALLIGSVTAVSAENQAQAIAYFEAGDYMAAQALLLQNPSEQTADLLAQCNDHCFIIDLQNALNNSFSRAGEDIARMSDEQVQEYYASLVADELALVEKYQDLAFSDAALAGYAHDYIAALQSQQKAISEYYGADQAAYEEYWTRQGQNKRRQTVYWMNRKYGLDVSAEHQDAFGNFVAQGEMTDMQYTAEEMLDRQLSNLQYDIKLNAYSGLDFQPISIRNLTDYTIEDLVIRMNLHNADGKIVDTVELFSAKTVKSGGSIAIKDVALDAQLAFNTVSIDYEFSVAKNEHESGVIAKRLEPQVQFAWGKRILRKNRKPLGGQPAFEAEHLSATWEKTRVGNQLSYAPALVFSVKNTSITPANEMHVYCMFVNQDTHEIWSGVTETLVYSWEPALQPGHSKMVAVYAQNGLSAWTDKVPNLAAEIYVNNLLVETAEIDRESMLRLKPTPKPTPVPTPTLVPTATPVPTETPVPTATPLYYQPLKQGDRGEKVLELKARMQELGYFAAGASYSDQYNGTTTERVKLFQKANGLKQTGVADAEMQRLLFSDEAKKNPY